jgi:hypothetical protein
LYELMLTARGTAPGLTRVYSARGVGRTTVWRAAVSGCGATGGAIVGARDAAESGDGVVGLLGLAAVSAGWLATVLSLPVTTGRRDGNSRGVMTMTSAIKTRANTVRLSMQVVELR